MTRSSKSTLNLVTVARTDIPYVFKGYPSARNYIHSWFKTFAVFWMFYAFFWVFPRRLNLMCRRFGTICSIFVDRRVGVEWLGLRNVGVFTRERVWLRLFSSQTFSRINTPTFLKPSHSTPTCLWRWNSVPKRRHKIQTPWNYPEESIKRITYSLSSKAAKLVHSSSVNAASKYRAIPFAAVLVRKCNARVLGS
jgi:hypothetical protein